MRNIRLQPHRETITVIKNYLEKLFSVFVTIKLALFLNNELSELLQFFFFKHFIQYDLKLLLNIININIIKHRAQWS